MPFVKDSVPFIKNSVPFINDSVPFIKDSVQFIKKLVPKKNVTDRIGLPDPMINHQRTLNLDLNQV